MKCCIYRHYDANGALLYIGMSNDAVMRSNAHCGTADWRYDIARIDVEWFPSREHAQFAEARAIISEKPKHNVAWNRGTRRQPKAPFATCQYPDNERGGKIVWADGSDADTERWRAFLRPGDSIVWTADVVPSPELVAFAVENDIDFREWE